jgi:uncharacterized protein
MYSFNITKKFSCSVSLKPIVLVIFLTASSSLNSTQPALSLGEDENSRRMSYFTKSLSTCEANVDCNIHHYYEPIKQYIPFEARKSCRVDLHGYSVEQARVTVKNMIQQTYGKNVEHIHFICGRGKHVNTQGNRGAIFKAFPQWLESKEIAPYILRSQKGTGTYEIFLNLPVLQEETSGHVLKIEFIKILANKNDSHAQFVLGDLYREGIRIKKDPKEALKWYKKAAIQGHTEAQVRMGYMCAMGLGIHYNPQKALFWYKEAAKQDYPTAYFNLGTMYCVGEGVTRDYATAIKYYLKAAQYDDVLSQRMLGIIYLNGLGGYQDDQEAIKWHKAAIKNGDPYAKVNLAFMLLHGRGCSPDPLAALQLYKEAAKADITDAYFSLAIMYAKGQGVERNMHEALGWYIKAALKNDGVKSFDAQFILGQMYHKGIILKEDSQKAAEWYGKAAENGHSDAQWRLGLFYRWGEGVPHDSQESFKWLQASAKKGNQWGQYHLGEMYYLEGYGIKPNKKIAFSWFRKAAAQGNAMACITINKISEDLKNAIELKDTEKLTAYGLVSFPLPEELKEEQIQNVPKSPKRSKRKRKGRVAAVNSFPVTILPLEKQMGVPLQREDDLINQGDIFFTVQPSKFLNTEQELKMEGEEEIKPEAAFSPPLTSFSTEPLLFVEDTKNKDMPLVFLPIDCQQKGWFHKLFGFPFAVLRETSKSPIGLM